MVEFKKRRIYFPGRFNSPESKAAYRRWLADTLGVKTPVTNRDDELKIGDLIYLYLEFARRHYGDGARGEYANCRHALQHLSTPFKMLPVSEFGPLRLKRLQQLMVEGDASRNYINQTVAKIKRMFRWGVSEELIPAEVLHAIESVPGLRVDVTAIRESKRKQAVQWEWVEPILGELSDTVAAMVQLQWYTGARSDSICSATVGQFNLSVDPWEWRPKHKTEHLEKEVVLFIGPRCQKVIERRLDGPPQKALFTPRAQRRNQRYNKFYRSSAYYRAVIRAIDRVNEERKKEGLEKIPHWTPHQIRHAKGTQVRELYGVEAAQGALGHASIQATQIYSQRRLELARRVAEETG